MNRAKSSLIVVNGEPGNLRLRRLSNRVTVQPRQTTQVVCHWPHVGVNFCPDAYPINSFHGAVALSLVPARLRAAEPDLEPGFDAEPLGKAMLFRAIPGTNTLMNVLDQVRVWRSSGHLEQAAIIRLPPGKYTLTEPIKLDARDHKITWIASDAAKTLISGGQQSVAGRRMQRCLACQDRPAF